jgi:Kef-type K+ transport system membrane component KefB
VSPRIRWPRPRWVLLALLAPLPALASGPDPAARVALALAVILGAAKLGAHVAVRLGQAAVLGELVAGLFLGNLDLLGLGVFEGYAADPSIDLLARLGVILLLFQVGLESTVRQMLSVGWSALLVATLGVVTPMALGFAIGAWLLPGAGFVSHAFIGATLSATSVGITARVMQDLGAGQSSEARTILGAAVIDDVLGLLLLSVVSGMAAAAAAGTGIDAGSILHTIGESLLFLVGSLLLGVWLAPRLFRQASRLRGGGVLLAAGLALCFVLSWAADAVGLAAIVGAFAAGLVLEELHYRDFTDRGEHGMEELVAPIVGFLSPIFFVVMGMRTDLRAFAQPGAVGLALALTVAAIAGKQACALGVLGRGTDRLTVGLGMIPRGEVGLIFANIGQQLVVGGVPLVSRETFAALVTMVVVTTLVTPPLLAWRIRSIPSPPPGERAG